MPKPAHHLKALPILDLDPQLVVAYFNVGVLILHVSGVCCVLSEVAEYYL